MENILSDAKLAIELEKKGYEFYTQTAAKTTNPLAASTLAGLAERELVHLERVKMYYEHLAGNKTVPEAWLKQAEIPPSKAQLLRPILEKLKTSLDRKFSVKEDIDAAYKIAEGLEVDSYHLYDKIAKESADPTVKRFYSALSQEEREHYAILDETLQYLNNPGEWFRLKEKWIVEG